MLPLVQVTATHAYTVVYRQKPSFDICAAPDFRDMTGSDGRLNWWDGSPYYDINIYIGGVNAGCSPWKAAP